MNLTSCGINTQYTERDEFIFSDLILFVVAVVVVGCGGVGGGGIGTGMCGF